MEHVDMMMVVYFWKKCYPCVNLLKFGPLEHVDILMDIYFR